MTEETRLRITRQRQVILEELRKSNAHPTADHVYELVRRRLPRISLATVYRNLELLAREGVISKIGSSVSRFESETGNHYHTRCIGCDSVRDLPENSISIPEKTLRSAVDFDIIDHRLEFLGFCPKCREQKPLPKQSSGETEAK